MGYLDMFSSKMLFNFKFKACMMSYDIILGNMEGLVVTLLFFEIESTNLSSWGILPEIFQKGIYFQI